MNDRELSGIEQGVWWTEHVIKHKGAFHLRSPTADMPFYKYLFLDAILALIISSIVLYFIIMNILRLICIQTVVFWATYEENKVKLH